MAAVLTSIGAGITLPVMNIIFGMLNFPCHGHGSGRGADVDQGRMVGSFTGYLSEDHPSITHEMFSNAINTCA